MKNVKLLALIFPAFLAACTVPTQSVGNGSYDSNGFDAANSKGLAPCNGFAVTLSSGSIVAKVQHTKIAGSSTDNENELLVRFIDADGGWVGAANSVLSFIPQSASGATLTAAAGPMSVTLVQRGSNSVVAGPFTSIAASAMNQLVSNYDVVITGTAQSYGGHILAAIGVEAVDGRNSQTYRTAFLVPSFDANPLTYQNNTAAFHPQALVAIHPFASDLPTPPTNVNYPQRAINQFCF
jgi:hypothetical protein